MPKFPSVEWFEAVRELVNNDPDFRHHRAFPSRVSRWVLSFPWLRISRVPPPFPATHAITTTPANPRASIIALTVLLCPDSGSFRTRWQPSPNLNGVGLRITLFEASSVFTHVTACALPDSPTENLFLQYLNTSVTFGVPPGGSGWSDQFPGGLFPFSTGIA